MEFHGILSRSKVPWNSMALFPHSRVPWNSMEFHGTFSFPPKSSMEFHGIPWNFFWSSMEFHGIPWNLINFIFKKIIFLNIVFGIWLMISCYLAKISQKRYKLHWFQYRNSYFEHPSVSENGTRSAKMACCYIYIYIYIYIIQMKIGAEYRDVLPRLLCQEPGLRPIGRSPGVRDKSSRGLGSMSWYSAQILICFIAYIFLFLVHCGFGWELCRTASMHSALCHCPL